MGTTYQVICDRCSKRLCKRYQARLAILTRAMRQADNPSEVFEALEANA